MPNNSEPTLCAPYLLLHPSLLLPNEPRVPRPLLPAPLLFTNAHLFAEAENRQYKKAYEKCTCPSSDQIIYSYADLDNEIVRQLTAARFTLPITRDMEAKLNRIVERIRNTWVRKYGSTFIIFPVGAPQGVYQPVPQPVPQPGYQPVYQPDFQPAYQPVHQPVLQPTDLTRNADGQMAPGMMQPGADVGAVNALAAGIQQPHAVPGTTTNYVPPPPPPRSEFTFRAPPPSGTKRFGKEARIAANRVAPKPLFADGQEVKLTWFERYTSLDKIHLPMKRQKTEQILASLPNESVARCMEALFRGENNVNWAEAWLRQTSSNAPGKHVIELFDSDDEDQGQAKAKDPDQQPAKKKQKVAIHAQGEVVDLTIDDDDSTELKGPYLRPVSELEEGEILEDEPAAAVPKLEPVQATNSSFAFGAISKPVFGQVWQPGFKFGM